VDIAQDPSNCGLCGVICPSGICALSFGDTAECLPQSPSGGCLASCGAGSVCAQGGCVDASCVRSEDCAAADGAAGICCIAGAADGWTVGACSDLASDPQNCGGCGFVCPSGATCSHGVCSGTPANCGVGRIGGFCDLDAGPSYVCCPGLGCTDLASDGADCGTCGNTCDAGMSCVEGSCR
jgi:hypothetical protein